MKKKNFSEVKLCRRPPRALKCQIDKLLDECFGKGAGRIAEQLTVRRDKLWSAPLRYILIFNGKGSVAGILLLYKRRIFYGGKKIVFGGFGELCVRPEKRRKGLGLILMGIGVRELKKESCEVIFLRANIAKMEKFFRKFDFVPLGKKYAFWGRSGKRYAEKCGMIAPGVSREKFDFILSGRKIINMGRGTW